MILSVIKLIRVILNSIIFFVVISCSKGKEEVDKKIDKINIEEFKSSPSKYYDKITFSLLPLFEIDSANASKITDNYVKAFDPLSERKPQRDTTQLVSEWLKKLSEEKHNEKEENYDDFIERMISETGVSEDIVSNYVIILAISFHKMEKRIIY